MQKAYRVVTAGLSLGIAYLLYKTGGNQLDAVGFAAGNRQPSYFWHYLDYFLAALAIANAGLAFYKLKPAAAAAAILAALLVVSYFISW